MHGWAFKGIRGQISTKIETDLEQWEKFSRVFGVGLDNQCGRRRCGESVSLFMNFSWLCHLCWSFHLKASSWNLASSWWKLQSWTIFISAVVNWRQTWWGLGCGELPISWDMMSMGTWWYDEFINLFCKAFFAFLMCDDDVIISRIVTGNMMVLLFSAEMLFNVWR